LQHPGTHFGAGSLALYVAKKTGQPDAGDVKPSLHLRHLKAKGSVAYSLQSLQVGMKLHSSPSLFKGINDIFFPVYLERANNWKRIDLLK